MSKDINKIDLTNKEFLIQLKKEAEREIEKDGCGLCKVINQTYNQIAMGVNALLCYIEEDEDQKSAKGNRSQGINITKNPQRDKIT